MKWLFAVGFVVLWYFLGFWSAVVLTLISIAVMVKPDLVYAGIGLGLLYIGILTFLAL